MDTYLVINRSTWTMNLLKVDSNCPSTKGIIAHVYMLVPSPIEVAADDDQMVPSLRQRGDVKTTQEIPLGCRLRIE